MQQNASRQTLSSSDASLPRSGAGMGVYRQQAWDRYRLAAKRFAQRPDDRRIAEELEVAVEGLRRAAAVAAWRRG